MNESKTEFIYFGWPSQLGKCCIDKIDVNGIEIQRSNSTKYLGEYLDSKLDFREHIKNKCKAAMLNLHRIKAARKSLTRTACNKLVVTLVLSHLDYANSILGGLPKSSINKMQAVQNLAAKITLGKCKYDSASRCHSSTTLATNKTQNRLQDHQHSAYKCLHNRCTALHLTRMIEYSKPGRQRLRSEIDTTRLLVPQTSK